MSVEWLDTFDDLKKRADDIQAELVERNQDQRAGANVSQLNSSLRSRLADFGSRISKLSDSLKDDRSITASERARRTDLINNLRNRKTYLENAFKNPNTGQATMLERSYLFTGSESASVADIKKYGGEETADTRNLNNQGLVQMQRDVMQSQDESLEQLSNAIRNQKKIGLVINDELNLQSRLLDDLEDGVDHTQHKLSKERTHISGALKKTGGTMLLVTIIVLVAIIIALLVFVVN